MRTIRPLAVPAQRGVTLVIVLMLLVVVTLLGVGAARMAMLAERSARNDRDYQVAWQAAEAALMDAQFDIRGPNASASQRMDLFDQNNTSVFQPGCNTTAPYLGLCEPAVEGAKPASSRAASADIRTRPESIVRWLTCAAPSGQS